MYRNDDPSTVAAPPAVPSGAGLVPGFFTNGNAAAGQQATIVPDWWLTQQQEEPLAFLIAAGITPAKGTNNQVLAAARTLFSTLFVPANAPSLLLPSGLIIQSFGTPGVVLGPANQAISYQVTYPIAFPNKLIAIFARDNANACITWGSFTNPGLASAQGWVWSSAPGSGNAAAGAVTAIGY